MGERLARRADAGASSTPAPVADALPCHICGMADSALVDEALAALVARLRAAEIDAAYAAYDARPLDENDEWGDLASFRAAAGAS